MRREKYFVINDDESDSEGEEGAKKDNLDEPNSSESIIESQRKSHRMIMGSMLKFVRENSKL